MLPFLFSIFVHSASSEISLETTEAVEFALDVFVGCDATVRRITYTDTLSSSRLKTQRAS